MHIKEKDDIINLIIARFGDLHEFSSEELANKSVDELRAIAHRDSVDQHR